jgi:hypothetical protein
MKITFARCIVLGYIVGFAGVGLVMTIDTVARYWSVVWPILAIVGVFSAVAIPFLWARAVLSEDGEW